MMLLVVTALVYGVRHGIDWDHLAAITDVTSAQDTPRRGMLVASAYAAGHGIVVFGLGLVAIVANRRLPPIVDDVMSRVVGATLIVLAISVIVGLARDRHGFRIRSRWMLIGAGAARVRRWARQRTVTVSHDHAHADAHHLHAPVSDDIADQASAGSAPVSTMTAHRHEHSHVGSVPADPFTTPGPAFATGIGMLHGVGAETPTQIIVFLTAAHVAGGTAGVLLLTCFIAGIFVSNTVVAVAASYGYLNAARSFRAYATVAIVNAVASLVIGTVFITGGSLPAILGG